MSILVTDVVLARALAKKGSLTLVGSGACMEPAIKEGDAVRVDPVELREAKVGQVAVFRRHDALLAHRIVSTGGDGEPHLVTRSDANTGADDGPLYEDDFIGVVAAIERRGRPRRLAARPPDEPAWRRSARARYLVARSKAKIAAMRGLSEAQRLEAYRSLATRALASTLRDARIVVRLPLHAGQTHDLHRELTLDEALTAVRAGEARDEQPPEGAPPDRFELALLGDDARRGAKAILASLTVVRLPDDCPEAGWWLVGLDTRMRRRAAGLEEPLLGAAASLLAAIGARELKADPEVLSGYEQDLLRRNGFTPRASSPGPVLKRILES